MPDKSNSSALSYLKLAEEYRNKISASNSGYFLGKDYSASLHEMDGGPGSVVLQYIKFSEPGRSTGSGYDFKYYEGEKVPSEIFKFDYAINEAPKNFKTIDSPDEIQEIFTNIINRTITHNNLARLNNLSAHQDPKSIIYQNGDAPLPLPILDAIARKNGYMKFSEYEAERSKQPIGSLVKNINASAKPEPVSKEEETVQLDFEPQWENETAEISGSSEVPPIEAYAIDSEVQPNNDAINNNGDLWDDIGESNKLFGEKSIETLQNGGDIIADMEASLEDIKRIGQKHHVNSAGLDDQNSVTPEIPTLSLSEEISLSSEIEFNAEGRWQVVSSVDNGSSHSVLFSTDDPIEAVEALTGYELDKECSLNIYDSTNGGVIISRNGDAVDGSLAPKEFEAIFQKNSTSAPYQAEIDRNGGDSLAQHTDSPLTGMDANEIEPIDSEQDVKPDDNLPEGETSWESVKSKKPEGESRIEEPEDLEDDRTLAPSGGNYSSGRQNSQGAGQPVSAMGMLGSFIGSGINSIIKKVAGGSESPDGPVADCVPDKSKPTAHSSMAQFNNADIWASNSQAKELTILHSDMDYAVKAISAFADLDCVKEAGQITSLESPTDEQKQNLALLKANRSYVDAQNDVEGFLNDVKARSSRLLRDENIPSDVRTELGLRLNDWSKQLDKSIEALPNDEYKKDLLDKIKAMIDQIIDRLTPKKRSEVEPSIG